MYWYVPKRFVFILFAVVENNSLKYDAVQLVHSIMERRGDNNSFKPNNWTDLMNSLVSNFSVNLSIFFIFCFFVGYLNFDTFSNVLLALWLLYISVSSFPVHI
jgi:hypothetical protein